AGNRPVELEKTQISLAVDRAGPHDDDTLAAPCGRGGGELSLELGTLVNVSGTKPIAFRGRRTRDVAMHTAGRAVDDSLAIEAARGLEHIPGAAHVDVVVVAIGMARSAKHCRDVVNLIAAARCGDHVLERRQLANAHVDTVGSKRLRSSRISHERAYLVAPADEPSGQVSAREAGGAGDEYGAWHGEIVRCRGFRWQSRSRDRAKPSAGGGGCIPRMAPARAWVGKPGLPRPCRLPATPGLPFGARGRPQEESRWRHSC